MIRRPPRSTHCISSAASDVYKRQDEECSLLKRQLLQFIQEKLKERFSGTRTASGEIKGDEEVKEEVKASVREVPIVERCGHRVDKSNRGELVKCSEGLGAFKDYFNSRADYKGGYHEYRILNNLTRDAEISWSNKLSAEDFNIDNIFL
eukprot:TRINITY_DN2716_c0_g1_i11.p1 TRINITY_DN2716_c0_g1~~TRINITY_DN2716_c0_g1_i11.p1  ORF type:complete len:156 (+),score=54.28 TRINITY_DN2716_c0_g1_i11:22-468(+)